MPLGVILFLITLFVILMAGSASAAELARRKSRVPVIDGASLAPDELHSVRRSCFTQRPRATLVGLLMLAGSPIFAFLLLTGDGVWRIPVIGLAVIGQTWNGLLHAGIWPAFLGECLASGHEIRCGDLRGEAVFERGSASVEIKTKKGFIPYLLVLRSGQTKRKVGLDDRGLATLRALGWAEGGVGPLGLEPGPS